MEQLQKFSFEMPEIAQSFLRDVEGAEGDNTPQESNGEGVKLESGLRLCGNWESSVP